MDDLRPLQLDLQPHYRRVRERATSLHLRVYVVIHGRFFPRRYRSTTEPRRDR